MSTQTKIHADPSCHWCYLALELFDRARDHYPDDVFVLMTAPYAINPDLPTEGMPLDQYFLARFGDQSSVAAELKPLVDLCAENEIALNLDAIKTMPNVESALCLLHWAREVGADYELLRLMQRAYFQQGQDLGDFAVLRTLAESVGMDGPLVSRILKQNTGIADIRTTIAQNRKAGLTEIPAWIIGDTYVVTGVQTLIFWQNVIGEIDEAGRKMILN